MISHVLIQREAFAQGPRSCLGLFRTACLVIRIDHNRWRMRSWRIIRPMQIITHAVAKASKEHGSLLETGKFFNQIIVKHIWRGK